MFKTTEGTIAKQYNDEQGIAETLSKDHKTQDQKMYYCPLVTSWCTTTFCVIVIIRGNNCHLYLRVCAYPTAACTEEATRLLERGLNLRL